MVHTEGEIALVWCEDCGGKYLDVDKNLGAAVVVVPIAAMAAMLNKRMMVVLAVKPALIIMVVGQGASCTGSDKENG
jgi:hypothetical protein